MVNSPLEFLAQKYENVVKYDADGNPSIFVKFPKMKSSDLDASLPGHTHPAFIVNGIEQDYILLGRYKAGENGVLNGALISCPNIMPARSLGTDAMLSRMKAAGQDISGMTIADYGFIKLLAQKHGWAPNGNTAWGQSHIDATPWVAGETATAGETWAFEGWEYSCLVTHTTAAETKPDIAPAYWAKGDFIGAVSLDTERDATHQTGYRVLNGTGPMDWYLGGDEGSMVDLIGSSFETQFGYRVVDGEIQILPDNNAADPEADLAADSAAWKAILPNLNNDGYSFVAPGTARTLHWNWDSVNEKIMLDYETTSLEIGIKTDLFTNITIQNTHLPYVPHIVKELGLIPTGAGDKTPGSISINFIVGERIPRRGGKYNSVSAAGLGAMDVTELRSKADPGYGCRPRALAGTLIPGD